MADVTITYGRLNHWSIYIEETITVQYVYYDDGMAKWRKGVRDGIYVIDKALTELGFIGTELDDDWENVYSVS